MSNVDLAVKQLKEGLLGKEVKLDDLDSKVFSVIKDYGAPENSNFENNPLESIFDADTEYYAYEVKSFAYTLKLDTEDPSMNESINTEWEIIKENNESIAETIVKITKIEQV